MLQAILASVAIALKHFRFVAWLVPAAIGAIKQMLGWPDATWFPQAWVWWVAAMVALFMDNAALRHQLARVVKPNIGAADAYKSILARSKRGKELVRRRTELLVINGEDEDKLTETGIVEERLKKRLIEEIHGALRQGCVRAWGTPSHPSSSGPEREIEAAEWDAIELDLDSRRLDSIPLPIGGSLPISARSREGHTRQLRYTNIRFSKVDVFREFPLAVWPRRIDWVPLRKPST